jgi:hypothetical protein
MFVDPLQARQERERQERERLARIQAEKKRLAKIKAENERQAQLKEEKKRLAKLREEKDRQAKLKEEKKHSDQKPTEVKKTDTKKPDLKAETKKSTDQKPENKKPQSENKTDDKASTDITWSKPGETSPVYSSASSLYSRPPIGQGSEAKPKVPLGRKARPWNGEKTEEPEPKPEPKPYKPRDLSGFKQEVAEGRAKKEQEKQEQLQHTLKHQQQKDDAANHVLKQEGGHDLFKDLSHSILNGASSFAGNAQKTGTALFNGASNFWMPSAAAAETPSNQTQVGNGEVKSVSSFANFNNGSIKPLSSIALDPTVKPFAPLSGLSNGNTSKSSPSSNKSVQLQAKGQPSQLKEGQTIGNFGHSSLVMLPQIERTFKTSEGATAYASSLKRPSVVTQQGNQYVIHPLSDNNAFFPEGHPTFRFTFTRKNLQNSDNPQSANLQNITPGVKAIVTSDGYQVRPQASSKDPAQKGANGTQMQFYDEKDLAKQYAGQQEAFGPGLSNIKDKKQFLRQYNLSMRNTAFSLLSASEQEAKQKQAVFAKGNLAQDKPKIQKVATGLATLEQQIKTADAEYRQAQGHFAPSIYVDEIIGQDPDAMQKASQCKAQLEQQRKVLLTQYPLLSRIENPAEFNKLTEACGGVVKDIATTRQNLVKGKLNLWSMSPLVGVTTEGLGIQPEQMKWVSEKVKSDQTWDIASKVGLGVLSIGLAVGATLLSGGLLGLPAMEGVAAVMSASAFGIGLGSAISETNQYFTNQSATNTNLDPNKSIMPQDMKGHWGWVAASWVGAGLDFASAVHAVRLLKQGMEVDKVISMMTKAKGQNLKPEELKALYESSYGTLGKHASNPNTLRRILNSALSPEVETALGKSFKPKPMNALKFEEKFGSQSSDAVTVLTKDKNGVLKPQIFFKEGGNPLAIREEAAHLSQVLGKDKGLTEKLGQLTEENLTRWPKMTSQEQLSLYRTKVEVEIDAQRRLLKQFGNEPGYAKSVQQNLDNLKIRLGETKQALKNPNERPQWLDPDQAPRLFSKEWTGANEAAKRGWAEAENGYRWVMKDGQLTYEKNGKVQNLADKYFHEGDHVFKNADTNLLPAKYKGEPIRQGWTDGIQQEQASALGTERLNLMKRRDRLEALSPESLTPKQQQELTHLRAAVNERSRQLGKLAGESFIKSKYGDKAVLKWPPAGKGSTAGDFDQVWAVKQADGTEKYIVVEAKGGSSSLGTRKVNGGFNEAEQGNPKYFEEIAGVMAKASSSQSKGIGNRLSKALDSGNVEYWEVRAPISSQGEATGIKAREFDLSPSEAR